MQRILGEREEELGPRRLYVYPFGKIAQKLAICMKGEGGFVDAQTHTQTQLYLQEVRVGSLAAWQRCNYGRLCHFGCLGRWMGWCAVQCSCTGGELDSHRQRR
jgi:hypothetical protein